MKSKTHIFNSLFTRNNLRRLIASNNESVYTSVVKRYTQNFESKKNADLISEIYSELQDNYRNEYFYKNTLLNKLLLGVHSLNTTVALTEVPINKSKADFVLINGKAVVYEIKTELDNFDKLEKQINDYYKAFNYVSVVTHRENLDYLVDKVDNINKPIGIYILNKNGRLSTINKPLEYNDDLSSEVMFKMLRKKEYENILLKIYDELPAVSQFKYYTECKNMFSQIPILDIYSDILNELKKRSNIVKEEFVKVPYELKFLAYFMNLKSEDYLNMNNFLEQRFEVR